MTLEQAYRQTDPQLRRLHPLTPLLRSWQLVGVIAAVAIGAFGGDTDRLIWVWNALQGDADVGLLVQAALVSAAVAIVLLFAGWLSWRATWFALVADDAPPEGSDPGTAIANPASDPLGEGRVGGGRTAAPGTLVYHRGVLVRQRSRVRLDRVQSVDVQQPVLPRLFGLAVVSLDMAAGAGASVKLAMLRESEAWALRDEILRHARTRSATTEPAGQQRPAKAAEPTVIARISTHRLVQATLVEGLWAWALIAVLLVVWIGAIIAFGWPAVLGALPLTLSILVALVLLVKRQVDVVLREANFTLMRTSTGAIRISSGLLSTINRTIELDRVQQLRILEPLFWRWLGWARVEVDVAGGRRETEGAPAAALMPVADRDEAVTFVARITGADLDAPITRGPGTGARVLDPLAFPFLGVSLLEQGALTRHGRWRRTRAFVPYARVQSVSVRQSWLQRRLGLATVHLDMPSGVRRWTAPHQAVRDAGHLVDELVERARRQRAVAWSEPVHHPRDARSDHQPQHDAPDQLAPAVERRPRDGGKPSHERSDDPQRHQGDGQRRRQPDDHQHEYQAWDHQRR